MNNIKGMAEDLDKLHAALFTLLRSGLWEREVDSLSVFPLSAVEWEQVFRQSRQQTVTGIVYQGLQYLPDSMLPPEALLIRWTAEADAIERRNKDMDKALCGLYSLLRSHGLNPVLQKGQGVAQFYEKPLLRECGDIDLYFNNPRAMYAATVCIRWQKINVKKMPDKSAFYRWKGMEVEHHSRLFDLHNPFLQSRAYRLELEKGYDSVSFLPDPGIKVTVPSPFLNLLLLDLHILKHALGWGIGLRQLCDMARACHRLHGKVDREEMKAACRSLGLEKWNPLLHAFLTEHLGLQPSCLPYPETAPDARSLFDIVMKGGNFGYKLAERNQHGQSILRRKLRTARSFRNNLRFVTNYAPKEAFWLFAGLLKGQFK